MSAQRGFALFELTIATLIATLIAVFAADRLAQHSRDAAVEGYSAWMTSVRQAAQAYLEQNALALIRSGPDHPIDGFTDPMRPTVMELRAAGFLTEGFPLYGMRSTGARVQLLHTQTCPGEACRIEALIYSDTPLGLGPQIAHQAGMLAHWLLSSHGQGGVVMAQRSDLIAAAAFSFPNPPLGSMQPLPAGTVAMAVTSEQLASLDYLRVADERDPQFQGNASVAGDLNVGAAVHAQDYVRILGQAYARTSCSPDGAIVRERYGGLLVCRAGLWYSAGGSGGGGYSVNSVNGCVAGSKNLVTGDCSCPPGYLPVRIADSMSAIPSEGRTRGYVCVG